MVDMDTVDMDMVYMDMVDNSIFNILLNILSSKGWG